MGDKSIPLLDKVIKDIENKARIILEVVNRD